MSAMGQKQTSSAIVIYVRFWGKSGRSGLPPGMSGFSHKRKSAMPAKEAIYRKVGVSHTRWQKSPCLAICSGKSCGGSMICDEDPLRRRPRESTARRKRHERCVWMAKSRCGNSLGNAVLSGDGRCH